MLDKAGRDGFNTELDGLNTGDCAFAAPKLWNSLQFDLRFVDSLYLIALIVFHVIMYCMFIP